MSDKRTVAEEVEEHVFEVIFLDFEDLDMLANGDFRGSSVLVETLEDGVQVFVTDVEVTLEQARVLHGIYELELERFDGAPGGLPGELTWTWMDLGG